MKKQTKTRDVYIKIRDSDAQLPLLQQVLGHLYLIGNTGDRDDAIVATG